ncbi:MFS transporter [Nocardioides albertanoniae]|uniref:MFS transporter n=1 Tax=Nocardioides albertanoniae TaxID=1175486 RepID=UPI0011531BD5|nr:MFS transporter [Nocardioides albertanoniae]
MPADVQTDPQNPTSRLGARLPRPALMLAAVLLVAFNLRVAVTSLGTLFELAGLHPATQAVLTSLPVICFAVVGGLGKTLISRVGLYHCQTIAVGMLTAGLVVRVLDGPAILILGTVLACSGIALSNVLLPSLVKAHFPSRVGTVTGAYSAILSAGAAIGAMTTVPIAETSGSWRAGLLVWASTAALALVVWLTASRGMRRTIDSGSHRSLLRSPLAWAVTVVFALQSASAYVTMSWLPSIYAAAGLSPQQAGFLLAASILVGVPVYFAAPVIAMRMRSQGLLIAFFSLCLVCGYLGLCLAPAAGGLAWAVLIGVGGSVFPVTLSLFALRTSNAADTASLSAMGQGFGYLIAAPMPFAVGLLQEWTGSWALPCLVMATLCLIQTIVGFSAGRQRVIAPAR